MLCDKCNRNEAKVHLVCVRNEKREGIWLCEDCAKELIGKDLYKFTSDYDGLSLNSIFNSFFNIAKDKIDYKNIEKNDDKKCNFCGLHFEEFKKTRMLGCEKCYVKFRDDLIPLIKKVHFSAKHSGKYPRTHRAEYELNSKIKKLNNEMSEAILLQNYEKAAFIRDQIREIKKEEGNCDE